MANWQVINSQFAPEPQQQIIKNEVEKKSRRRWITWTYWITGRNTRDREEKIISHFSPTFNPNCYLVIISEGIREKHRLSLLIYEEIFEENSTHLIKIITSPSLGEAKRKANLIESNLTSQDELAYRNHPILVLLELGDKPIHFLDVVKKAKISRRNTDCIKKYDIIGIRINNTPSYHVAIYLGDGNDRDVAHISGPEGSPNEFRARFDSWNDFLEGREAEELVLNRLIIPFKRSELIQSHINESVRRHYGEGRYSVRGRNCEHFATLCVAGIPFSSQVENIFNLNLKLDKEKVNEERLNDNNFITQIEAVSPPRQN